MPEIEVGRETFEQLQAEAAALGVEPAEVLEMAHQRATPSLGFVTDPDELAGLTICSECRAWTRPPECWRCEVEIEGARSVVTRGLD